MKEKNLKNILTITFLVFLFFSYIPLFADSLWDKDFDGFLTQSFPVDVGETLLINIDSEFKFSLSSSSKDNKILNLEFSGGGYGDLFSFLPNVKSSGSGTMGSDEEISISTQLTVQVLSVDENNIAVVQGQRSVSVDGREETLRLSGSVSLKDIAKDRSVSVDRVINAKLSFSSLLLPSFEAISDADLKQMAMDVLGAPAETDGPTETNEENPGEEGLATAIAGQETITQDAVEPNTPATSPQPQFRLSEEKQKELFLIYVNRLVDVLFSQSKE